MSLLLFAETTSIIQIGTVQAFFGVAGILLAAGVAWGKLSNRVSNIEGDLVDLKSDVKTLNKDMASMKTDMTTIKSILMQDYRPANKIRNTRPSFKSPAVR